MSIHIRFNNARIIRRATIVSLLALSAAPVAMFAPDARAQNGAAPAKGPIAVELQAFKVTRGQDGKEVLTGAVKARPGDTLEYRATYTNVSQREVKNLQATLPIPTATELLAPSIAPKEALASADGRSFAAMPLTQNVKLASGKVESRPLPLSAYRALRWPVGSIPAGQAVTVSARVRLNGTLPTN